MRVIVGRRLRRSTNGNAPARSAPSLVSSPYGAQPCWLSGDWIAAAKLSEEQLQAFAEWIWVERWQGRSPVGPDVWPGWKTGCTTMDLLHERWQDVLPRRSEFIAELSEDRLQQNLEFKLVDGSAGSLALIGTMQNVVNHGTMHRGQIVGMIRQLGMTPPQTNLL